VSGGWFPLAILHRRSPAVAPRSRRVSIHPGSTPPSLQVSCIGLGSPPAHTLLPSYLLAFLALLCSIYSSAGSLVYIFGGNRFLKDCGKCLFRSLLMYHIINNFIECGVFCWICANLTFITVLCFCGAMRWSWGCGRFWGSLIFGVEGMTKQYKTESQNIRALLRGLCIFYLSSIIPPPSTTLMDGSVDCQS